MEHTELDIRFGKIRAFMKKEGAEAILVSSNANIYYTSLRFFRGYVYLPLEGKPVWFVIRPLDMKGEEGVVLIRKPEEIPGWLAENGYPAPSSIGLELDDMSYSDILRLQKCFPEASTTNASATLRAPAFPPHPICAAFHTRYTSAFPSADWQRPPHE